MQTILAIVASLIIIYIWIWILNTIFSEKRIKRLISFRILFTWIFLVAILFAYTYLAKRFPSLSSLSFQIASVNVQSIFFFILYCAIFTILLTVIFKNRYNKILQTILVGAIFFLAIAYGGYVLGLSSVLIFFLVSAYAEEYLKYNAGNNLLYEEKRINTTDLILFCILIALGFSLVENILYIVVNLINHNDVNVLQMLVGRGIISALIHVVATGLIAFITISLKKRHNIILPTLVGIIAGFGLHSLYNIGLNFSLSYVTIPVIIIAFFLLTYLFFRSDSLYKKS
jgi:RsiW-degrading membrane proteinase PrsW (M82 family)